ncbi:Hypothetical protein GLP15_50 [Giardia lamblia P15]|uniref:Uncharacterized protein n=1 Tax=Giardia intestinalis (strain P15) TaxID=658858 RepID=E1F0T0_GIAIA|nr:Hypothetical protein GLP15_50 [Giardia lamblia P15]
MLTAPTLKEHRQVASPRLELDDLLLQCKRAASRTPMNNTLGRSNGHSRSLFESRNSMYNSLKPLVSRIIDEPNPSLAFTHRICTSDITLPVQSAASEGEAEESRDYISSSLVSHKSGTGACAPSLLPDGLVSSGLGSIVSSPIQMRAIQRHSPSLRASSPLVLAKPMTYSASSRPREQKTPMPTAISFVDCCGTSAAQPDTTLRLSSLSSQRPEGSGPRASLPGLLGTNSSALFHVLRLVICQHHAKIIRARVDSQGYYLLVLNSSHSLLGLVQKLSSGALAKVWGKAFDFDNFATHARGKTLCDSMIKSYMVLRDGVICLEDPPVQYTNNTVGLVI